MGFLESGMAPSPVGAASPAALAALANTCYVPRGRARGRRSTGLHRRYSQPESNGPALALAGRAYSDARSTDRPLRSRLGADSLIVSQADDNEDDPSHDRDRPGSHDKWAITRRNGRQTNADYNGHP